MSIALSSRDLQSESLFHPVILLAQSFDRAMRAARTYRSLSALSNTALEHRGISRLEIPAATARILG